MKKLMAIFFTLSIFSTVSPAHAGGRDGGNGPKYIKCSDVADLTTQERRGSNPGDRVRCTPDHDDSGVDYDTAEWDRAKD